MIKFILKFMGSEEKKEFFIDDQTFLIILMALIMELMKVLIQIHLI